MEPITREEYYLAKIAGTYEGKTPKPVTNDEYYLATMAGDYSGNTPQPVTRLQYYMAKVAGVWGGSIPAPVTREEYYWAAIANGEGKVFPPVTREEHFLVLVADAYSVVLTVVTGNPALLENSKGNRGLESLTLYGKSTQGSTTGAQLFDVSEVSAETWLSTEAPIEERAVGYWTSGYIPVKTGNYICSSKGSARGWTYDADKNGLRYIANSGGSPIPIKEGEAFIRVTGTNTAAPQNFMFNEGNSIKPYEPYTGGKPSPSPEYPQEIENAGDAGEININVQGANLFDINDSSTIMDKYYVNVKKEFTLANGNYGRVFKLLPNTSYTWTQEQIADAEQGKPTDIQIALFDEIPTQGKIAKEIYYNSNVGEIVFKFNTDEKFVYLFVKTGHRNATKNRYTNEKMAMLNVGTEPMPYEPYKPVQKLIVPTPNGLPGIPVSSGGNYTDEKGQQWVCDEVDFKKGVYVQRIGKKTITSKDIFLKSSFSTNDVNYFALNNFTVHIGTAGEKDVIMSNCFVAGTYQHFSTLGEIFLGGEFGNVVYFSVDAQKYPDVETFKQWAVENGLMFLYQLADIVETHLTAEELSAYKTLRTYSPTTTVINDAGAGMSVGYKKAK